MTTLRLLALALAALGSGAATAASLFVRPTTVILARGESASAVTVTNSGDTPVTAQVRVFAWNQNANEDALAPTTALAASPPMVMIPAGQSQTVRLVRVASAPPAREETYRLLVDEIADRAAAADSGVQIQLRFSVPVFVLPKAKATAKLAFTGDLTGDALLIDAVNSGDSHAQISKVSLAYADGSSLVVDPGLVGYVLPDKSRQWRLALPADAPARGQPQWIRAVVNGQELRVKP